MWVLGTEFGLSEEQIVSCGFFPNLFTCVDSLPTCMSVHYMCVPGAHGGQNRASVPLERQL